MPIITLEHIQELQNQLNGGSNSTPMSNPTPMNNPTPPTNEAISLERVNQLYAQMNNKSSISNNNGVGTTPAPKATKKSVNTGKGNIDLDNRPQFKHADGSVSTVRSMSFNENGKEILIPTIDTDKHGNPRQLSDQAAIDRYHRTGEYLGKFDTVEEANKYAEELHNSQAKRYPTNDSKQRVYKHKEDGKIDVISDKAKEYSDRKQMYDARKDTLLNPADYATESLTSLDPKATTGYQTNSAMYNYASKDKLSSDEKKAVKKEYKNLKKYGIEENTDNQRQKLKNAIDDGTLSADYVNAVRNAYMKSSMEGQAMTGIVNLGSALAEPIYLGGSLYERAKGKEGVWTEANNARKETLAELNKANPVGATIGSFAGKGIQYAAANELMNGIPVLKNAKDAMAGSLGGKTGEMLADVTFDMIPDLALDTLPTEVDNYLSGMSGKDIAKDTAKNIATNYAFNLIMGGLQNGKGIADELSANRQNARTNELAKNWLGLDKEAIGDAFEDNTKKAIADQLRAENPTLLGRLSDEDVYQFYLNSVEDELKNQNYENIKNVVNNTDNSVPTLKSNGVEETTGLDFMSNESDALNAINEFRANNPSMQANMTDRDVLNYIQASNEAKALEAQNRGIYDILENTDETNAPIPTNADDVDIDNMLREVGLEDYITEEPTYTKPLPVNERFEDLKNGSSMKGVAKEYTDKDVVNGIRFRTPEERTLFKERLNNFYKAVDAIDDVTSKEELDVARANINKAFAELGDSLKNGGHLDNSQREVNKKLRQQLFASLEGTKIYVDDLARAELKDFRTIREMNNKFGKNVFTSNPNVKGVIPIDMMWSQIDDLTGGQLGEMPSHNGDAIYRLIELSQDLRSNSKLSNFVADDIRVSDVISDELKNELREVIGVYDNFFNNNKEIDVNKGINVYRGYNRSDSTKGRNLTGAQTIWDKLGKSENNDFEDLPLSYYTESADVAKGYANQDVTYYNSLRDMAIRDYRQAIIDGKINSNVDEKTWVENRMNETYRTITGRDLPSEGIVKGHTIYPQNTLDISELGENPTVNDVYNYLSSKTGKSVQELDNELGLLDIADELEGSDTINAYSLLRNNGNQVGTRFTNFMRNNGYDSIRYAEEGTNHYALLDEANAYTKEGLNQSKYNGFNDDIPTYADLISQQEEIAKSANNTVPQLQKNKVMAESIGTKAKANIEDDLPVSRELPSRVNDDSLTLTEDYNGYVPEEGYNVSEFRTNTFERNSANTDEILEKPQFDVSNYVYKMQPHEVTKELAKGNLSTEEGIAYFLNKFTSENYKPSAAEENATIAQLYRDTLDQYLETGDESLIDLATKLSKAAQVRLTDWAQGVDSGKLWADTPAGILNSVNKDIKNNVDVKYGKGFANRVDEITSEVTDIINDSSLDETTKIDKVNNVFKDKGSKTNKKIKGQQEMIDLIKTGKPVDVVEINDILAEINKIPNLDTKTQGEILKYAQKAQGLDPNSEEAKQLIEQINRVISRNTHFSLKDKAIELQHILMLTALPTSERNLLANVAMLPNEKMASKLSALGQYGYKLLKDSDYSPTQSVIVPKKYYKLAEEVYNNIGGSKTIESGISGKYTNALEGKFGATEMFPLKTDGAIGKVKKGVGLDAEKNTLSQIPGLNKLFSAGKKGLDKIANKVGAEGSFDGLSAYKSNTENFRQLIYGVLEAGDKPFVKKNFTNRLASYLSAQKITDLNDIPEEAINIARGEALKATFKDDNDVVEFFKALKRIPIAGELELPYVKTPANVTARGIDFSPFGLINVFRKYGGQKGTVSDMFDDLGKIGGGTAMGLLGMYLSTNGILQGALSDDTRVRDYQKSIGIKPYSVSTKGMADYINQRIDKYGLRPILDEMGIEEFDFGDRYETIDWAQPAVASIMGGMSIYDAIENGEELNPVEIAKNATGAYANSLMQNSTLQNFLDLLDTSNGKQFTDNLLEDAIELPLRYIPAALNTQAKAMDNTQRSTFVKGDPLQSAINSGKAKIPELSKTLPASHDDWGRVIEYQKDTKSSYINNYFNPGKLGNDAKVPFGKEIDDLYENTKKQSVYPPGVDWKVKDKNGEDISLDNVTREQLKEKQGQYCYEYADKFFKSDLYKSYKEDMKNMSEEEKQQAYADMSDRLSKLYSVGSAKAKNELFGTAMSQENAKLAKMIDEEGIEKVFDSFQEKKEKKAITSELESQNINPSKKNIKIYEEKENSATVLRRLEKNGKTQEGKFTVNSMYVPLRNMSSLSDEDKGYYLANKSDYSLSKPAKKAAEKGKYADVWLYTDLKMQMDKNNNGSLDKNEKSLLPTLLKEKGIRGRDKEIADWYNK